MKRRLDYQPTASLIYCLTVKNMANQLSRAEVRRILGQKHPPAITDELYSFGTEMVKDASDGFRGYDDKATKIAGYAGAILAILVTEYKGWSRAIDWWTMPLLFGAALLALISAALGVATLWLRVIAYPSPRDWIREDQFSNPDRLRRYHILAMYRLQQSYVTESVHKAKRLKLAQWTLVAAGALLFLAMLDASALKLEGPARHTHHPVTSAVAKATTP